VLFVSLFYLRAVLHAAIECGLRGAKTRETRLGTYRKNRYPADSRIPKKGETKRRCGPRLYVHEQDGELMQDVSSKPIMKIGDMQGG
jgi:hypothetical protein